MVILSNFSSSYYIVKLLLRLQIYTYSNFNILRITISKLEFYSYILAMDILLIISHTINITEKNDNYVILVIRDINCI